MKHLTEIEEQKLLRKKQNQAQEPRIGTSPKAQLSQYLNQSQIGPGQQFNAKNSDYSNFSNKKQTQQRILSSSACKMAKANAFAAVNTSRSSISQTSNKSRGALGLELCKKCKKRQNYENHISEGGQDQISHDESHDFYYEKIRFLIVDCLDSLTSKLQDKFETNNGDKMDISVYHERIIRFLVDDFMEKGFKYISIIPGGFNECHDLALQYNFSMLNHEKGSCFHCDKSLTSKKHRQYNQQYNLVGFSEIFYGFKNWYDIAGTKLKSFVRGPIKIMNNQVVDGRPSQQIVHSNPLVAGSSSENPIQGGSEITHNNSNSSIYNSLVNTNKQISDSRNQGPHTTKKGGKHQHKTTDDNSKIQFMHINHPESDINLQPNILSHLISPQRMTNNDKIAEITLGSLPISFVSQSSRQDVFSQLPGNNGNNSQCSSNLSGTSSHNEGNNLREAITNKKIMSYKLMSKVPGDRNDVIGQQSQSQKEDNQVQQEVQNINIIVNHQQEPMQPQEEEKKQQVESLQVLVVETNNISTRNQKDVTQIKQIQERKKSQSSGPNSTVTSPGGAPPVSPENDCYNQNGITRQVEVNKEEFQNIITKKSNIVFRAHKLYLKKKNEISSTNQSTAYSVYLIITNYSVSVLRERKERNAAHLLSQMNQSVESSISQIDEWDQADFDELHPSLQGSDYKPIGKKSMAVAILESRFLMHDLIKITSRKSSAKIITFYFRIPLFGEYEGLGLEQNMVQNLDQKPPNFNEVAVSFEFTKEDDAKQCINNVSSIYKKLKAKK